MREIARSQPSAFSISSSWGEESTRQGWGCGSVSKGLVRFRPLPLTAWFRRRTTRLKSARGRSRFYRRCRRYRGGGHRRRSPGLVRLAPRRSTKASTSQLGSYRTIARARVRRALLLGRRRGARLGGIPSFSAAVSETQSSAVSAGLAARARLRVATGVLGQLDQAGGRGWELAARHWPQLRQMVLLIAGSAAGHRIEGMLPGPAAAQATCSVSRAQPEQ
jgi:hypothetical protein